MLTVQQVAQALPPNLKSAATQQFVDQINNIVSDPIVAEQVRDNFLSYTKVLQEGKFKTEDYLHAVTYVSYKLMGMSNQDAYFRTFPQRHAQLVARGCPPKDIAAYVSAYNRGKLVNLILEQSLVPTWVLNQDAYQKAINLQKPKEAGPLVNIDMRESSGMNELKDMLVQLAEKQRELISGGVSTEAIAAQRIVDVDAVEVGNGNP